MTSYELFRLYFEALLTPLAGRVRDDERGITVAETIVLVGVALLGAGAIGVILWGKLRDGANDVNVPAPAAP